jgi:hypothetical protein
MANYTKATNFTAKDGLPTGNSGKIVKGTEIDTEFTAIASAISSKADLNSPALTGTPTAPTASAATNTTQVATTAFVQTALSAAFTSGMIMMWSGTIATIPTGWVLCNGSNSTPDLRNRFVIGAHTDSAGVAYSTVTGSNTQTGGTKDAIVVSHTHTFTGTALGTHAHETTFNQTSKSNNATPYILSNPSIGENLNGSVNLTSSSVSAGTPAGTNSTEGSSGTNQNLPPYYALAYIMKT